MLSRIKKYFKKSKNSYIKSYSQCGEDAIIKYVFALKGIKKPSYLDIGAHHPTKLSNTALFYSIGCSGINIEPNESLYKEFVKKRSRDLNFNFGISSIESTSTFYEMKDSTLSTFSKTEYSNYLELGYELMNSYNVEVVSIEKLLKSYCNSFLPDFLTIDAEGYDFQILKSLNFQFYRPKIVCLESRDHSKTGFGKKRVELLQFLIEKGYFEYADTGLNSIMVCNEFWISE